MEAGDAETLYGLYALHSFGWNPLKFAALPLREKAAVCAMIDYKLREERSRRQW